MAAGGLLSNGFFTSNLLRAMAENTALVISVTSLAQYGPMPPRTPKKVLQQPTCPESGPGNRSDISRVSDFTLCFEGLNT